MQALRTCHSMNTRRGITLWETVVALGLMAIAAGSLSVAVAQRHRSQAEWRTIEAAQQAVLNERERVGLLPVAELDAEKLSARPAPADLVARGARWRATVDPVTQPIAGRRVALQLTWVQPGGASAQTKPLVFWIADRPDEALSP